MLTDTSKPWYTTITLGQRIVRELGLAESADTLGRWLAHHVAEQMERAAAAPEGEEGEAARRECVDLIVRLWERRYHSPLSRPLKEVAAELEALTHPRPYYYNSREEERNLCLELLHGLQDLHEQEVQLCLSGWVAGIDLTQERAYLSAHPQHLSEEERQVSQRLIELQDALTGPDAMPGGRSCPQFATMLEAERLEWIQSQLRVVSEKRAQIVDAQVSAARIALATVPSSTTP